MIGLRQQYLYTCYKMCTLGYIHCRVFLFCSKQDIALSNYQLHELHCARHIQLCKVCGEPVPRGKLTEHEQEEHRDEECEYCMRVMPLHLLEQHKVRTLISQL